MKGKDPHELAEKLVALLVRDPIVMGPKDSVASIAPSPTPRAAEEQRGKARG